MVESLSHIGLMTALFLPWIFGCIWVRWMVARSGQWNWPIVLGQGYLVGIFVSTLFIRLWDLSGLTLSFTGIAAILLVFGGLGVFLQRGQTATRPKAQGLPEMAWEKLIVFCLLALITWRYVSILQEIIVRPLYSWDSWMNWTPKAITWYHNNELSSFVSPESWLQTPVGETVYTLGNSVAWKYPPTVPLMQLWTMMGAQTSDHSLLFIPWWLLAISLGLALYGHLRLAGSPVTLAVAACYLLLSLPYLNVHTALAGYADIWVTAAFSMAIFAINAWHTSRHFSYGVLGILLALACSQLKIPGIVLAAIVLVVFSRSWLTLKPKSEWIAAAASLVVVALVLLIGIDVSIPGVGRVFIDASGVELPVLGSFSFQYHNVSSAMVQSLFLSLNWNILWALFLLNLMLRVINRPKIELASNELLALILTISFLSLVFYFTAHSAAAMNFTTLNRALLYPIPILVFYIFCNFPKRGTVKMNGSQRM